MECTLISFLLGFSNRTKVLFSHRKYSFIKGWQCQYITYQPVDDVGLVGDYEYYQSFYSKIKLNQAFSFQQQNSEFFCNDFPQIQYTEAKERWLENRVRLNSYAFHGLKKNVSSLCIMVSRSIHVSTMTQFHSFLWLSSIPLYIQTMCSLTIHPLMDIEVACTSCVKSLSRVRFFATPWTVAHQVPLSMGFSRQEYQNGLPFPPPGDLRDPGIKLTSLTSPELAGGFFTKIATWEALRFPGYYKQCCNGHWGSHVFLELRFFSGHVPRSGTADRHQCMCVASRRKVQMNLFPGQEQRCSCKEQTHGPREERR